MTNFGNMTQWLVVTTRDWSTQQGIPELDAVSDFVLAETAQEAIAEVRYRMSQRELDRLVNHRAIKVDDIPIAEPTA